MTLVHRPLVTCLAFAALFTFLFHGTGIGLNLLLFEVLVFGALFAMRRLPMERYVMLTVGGSLLTAVMVVLYGSSLALVVNMVSVVFAVGVLLAPELGALHHSAALAGAHLLAAQQAFVRLLPVPDSGGSGLRLTPRGVLSITLLPLIVLLFATLYSGSNPYFGKLVEDFYSWLGRIDSSLPFVFLLGLVLSTFLLLATRNEQIVRWARAKMDALVPSVRMGEDDHRRSVRSEAAIGILLLASLNALLLLLNALDIHHVWFNFRFEGQYLKAFVHEGTWLLIVSIVLGALIVLYYFRGDLNFHARNRMIKMLSYLWLTQNALLVVSVAIRNYWYIHHYALAYKRIGVAFFLLATLVGLLLIMVKVRRQRSHHFLVRWNMVSLYGIALLMTLVDWDTVIARYNMAQRGRAFIELNYLATLSDKTLPYLLHSTQELAELDRHNEQVLGGPERYHRRLYMPPERFAARVHDRVEHFLDDYPERSWKEWNAADARAHAKLSVLGGP
jgi:hypothetical protein